jgi:hypothetical protein
MSVILATQEAEIRRISVQNQLGEIACETLSQKKKTKPITKIRLMKWLKVKSLNSNHSTTKKFQTSLVVCIDKHVSEK